MTCFNLAVFCCTAFLALADALPLTAPLADSRPGAMPVSESTPASVVLSESYSSFTDDDIPYYSPCCSVAKGQCNGAPANLFFDGGCCFYGQIVHLNLNGVIYCRCVEYQTSCPAPTKTATWTPTTSPSLTATPTPSPSVSPNTLTFYMSLFNGTNCVGNELTNEVKVYADSCYHTAQSSLSASISCDGIALWTNDAAGVCSGRSTVYPLPALPQVGGRYVDSVSHGPD